MTLFPGSSPRTNQTEWASRQVAAPLRAFLRTEAASAGVLVVAIAAALVWSNVSIGSYESVWHADFSIRLGGMGVERDLRTWVNSGLMALFFLVIGLEARREFDLGELRDRTRFVLPLTAGLLGMLVPVLVYLAVTRGTDAEHGWGVAMSTDTALALGFLALLGPGVSDRVRVFLLTLFVVDDVVALLVIATVYSGAVSWAPVAVAVGVFLVLLVALRIGVDLPLVYVLLGLVIWGALLDSGIDPVVAGLAIGLAGSAYSPTRDTLEQASSLFRSFREQPTAELARTASVGLTSTLSPNARLQRVYLPWTSYVIVPLFGLANAGFAIDGDFLSRAVTSPITLGIVAGYVVGKPVAVLGTTWAVSRTSRGRIRPPGGLGGRCRQRHHRRNRVHRLAADRGPRLRRAGAGRGEARRADRGGAVRGGHLAGVPVDGAAVPRAAGPGTARADRAARRPRRTRRPGAGPRPRPGGRPGDAGGVRRLRVPALRLRGGGGPGRARRGQGPRLRLEASAADRRTPAGAAGGRGRRGSRRAGCLLADARPAAGPPGPADGQGPPRVRRRAWAWTGSASTTTSPGTRTGPGSPGTWSRPTSAGSPAPRPSSSTAAATTASTTWRP